jgi:hypothetical protein
MLWSVGNFCIFSLFWYIVVRKIWQPWSFFLSPTDLKAFHFRRMSCAANWGSREARARCSAAATLARCRQTSPTTRSGAPGKSPPWTPARTTTWRTAALAKEPGCPATQETPGALVKCRCYYVSMSKTKL